MPFIRSNRLSGTSVIEPRLIAEALFTQMSMPPNCATALRHGRFARSRRRGRRRRSAVPGRRPPRSPWRRCRSVPSSLGCGSAVLATSAMLAPSAATRLAIAKPDAAAGAGDEHGLPGERHGLTLGRRRRMSAVTASVSRTRSAGASATSQPRLPALHSTRSHAQRRDVDDRRQRACADPAARCRRSRNRWTARRRRGRPSRPSARPAPRRRPSATAWTARAAPRRPGPSAARSPAS